MKKKINLKINNNRSYVNPLIIIHVSTYCVAQPAVDFEYIRSHF